MSNTVLYRIYHKTPKHPHVLIGTVIAASSELALDKAKRDEWHRVYGEVERETAKENWVAMC